MSAPANFSSAAWTPERVAALKADVDAGLTFSLIAGRLGMTRSACIGKAQRLGLKTACQREREAKRSHKPPLPKGEPMTPICDSRDYLRALNPPPPMPEELTGKVREPIRCEPVPIWELRPGHCRWSVSGDPRDPENHRFCGRPVAYERFQWCSHHAEIGVNREARVRRAA